MILSDWYDLVNSIDSKNAKKVNEIEGVRKMVDKIEGFPKNITRHRAYWLPWLNHLSYFCELIESVHMYLVTYWTDWFIQVVTIHGDWINTFLYFPWLPGLIWHELYTSLDMRRIPSARDSLNSAARRTRLAQTQHCKYFGFTTLLRGQSTCR